MAFGKVSGGRTGDAHIHVAPVKVKKALEVMEDNGICYAVIIPSISGDL